MLHSSPGGEGQESITLRLDNGSVALETEVDGDEGVEHISTATGLIQTDTWYQLFATRYRDNCHWKFIHLSPPPSLYVQRGGKE